MRVLLHITILFHSITCAGTFRVLTRASLLVLVLAAGVSSFPSTVRGWYGFTTEGAFTVPGTYRRETGGQSFTVKYTAGSYVAYVGYGFFACPWNSVPASSAVASNTSGCSTLAFRPTELGGFTRNLDVTQAMVDNGGFVLVMRETFGRQRAVAAFWVPLYGGGNPGPDEGENPAPGEGETETTDSPTGGTNPGSGESENPAQDRTTRAWDYGVTTFTVPGTYRRETGSQNFTVRYPSSSHVFNVDFFACPWNSVPATRPAPSLPGCSTLVARPDVLAERGGFTRNLDVTQAMVDNGGFVLVVRNALGRVSFASWVPLSGGGNPDPDGGENPAPGEGETETTDSPTGGTNPGSGESENPAPGEGETETTDPSTGSSVAVSGDTAIVGVESDGNMETGSAIIFERSTSGTWSQAQRLTASDGKVRGHFGSGVAVSGSRVAVGAIGDDTNGQLSGAVYLFDKGTSGTWSQTAKFVASDGRIMHFLGRSVSVSGDTVIAGAYGYNEDEPVGGGEDASAQDRTARGWHGFSGHAITVPGTYRREAGGQGFTVRYPGSYIGYGGYGFFACPWNSVPASSAVASNTSECSTLAFRPTGLGGFTRNLDVTQAMVDNGGFVLVMRETFGRQRAVEASWVPLSGGGNPASLGAAYIFERGSDGAWNQTKLLASDGESGDFFGESVSISGNRSVIGAPRVDDNGQNSGAAYIFERDSDGRWTQVVKLSPDDGEREDFFGASVSISGDRAIVGSELDADEGVATGSAYIFERDSDGAWTQVQKLTAGDDAEVGDRFGESVSISGDRAVVGVDNSDSAYVYKRDSDGVWTLEEKLTPETAAGDYFGDAVAVSGNRVILISSRNTASIYEISSDDTAPRPDPEEGPVARVSETVTLPGSGKLTAGDGTAGDLFGRSASVSGARAIVGATGDRNNGVITGSAYVFEKGAEGSWTQVSKLLASDGAANDGFGISVSISGNRAIAGALNADGDATDPGAAYVFERVSSGVWTQVQKLAASDAADNDTFGTSVSMSGDRAIVGNTNDDDGGNNSGAAYIFDRSSDGTWTQTKLLASDGASLDEFGASVSMSEDRAVVSAIGDDDNGLNSGSAYVFDRNSEGAWSQSAKLIPEDGTAAHSFGISVSVSGDIAVVGADGDGDNGTRAGAAYVFERSTDDGTWAEVSKLTASDAEARDTFGRYVSVSGNRIVVGAEINGDNGAGSGSAYMFERNSDGAWSETTKLLAGDGVAGDLFGGSVAISGNTAVIAAPGDDTGRGSVYVYEPSTSAPSGPGAGPDSGPGGVDDRSAREAARLSIVATGGNRQSALSSESGGCTVSSGGSGNTLPAALALMLIPAFAGFGKRKRT